jgi:hypothetical protein
MIAVAHFGPPNAVTGGRAALNIAPLGLDQDEIVAQDAAKEAECSTGSTSRGKLTAPEKGRRNRFSSAKNTDS